MIGGINPYKMQEMQAGASSLMFGAGQQSPAVGAVGSFQGSVGGIQTGNNPFGNASLVDRLDKIDAGAVKPTVNGSGNIDGYDSELAVNGLTGVSGESIWVSQPTSVPQGNNNSLFSTLNAMDYELHPDTRDAFRGNALYLEG